MNQAAAVSVEQPQTKPINPKRFYLPDLNEHGNWLLDRLLVKRPSVGNRTLRGWLCGTMESNETLILCTPHSVGMARVVKEEPWSQPLVREVFLYCSDENVNGNFSKATLMEGIAIYREFVTWAVSVGASRVEIDTDSDIPSEMIRAELNRDGTPIKIFTRSVSYLKVGK